MKQSSKIALAVAAGAAALFLVRNFVNRSLSIGKVISNDFYDAQVTTIDGKHMVQFSASTYGVSVDAFMYYPENMNYGSDWDYWFHIGEYKTLKNAIRAAVKRMADFGYSFDERDFEKL